MMSIQAHLSRIAPGLAFDSTWVFVSGFVAGWLLLVYQDGVAEN
jgi:hypothetical protein